MGRPACAPGRDRQQGRPARSRRRAAHPARPGVRPRAGTVSDRRIDRRRPPHECCPDARPGDPPEVARGRGRGQGRGAGHRWRRPRSRWSTGSRGRPASIRAGRRPRSSTPGRARPRSTGRPTRSCERSTCRDSSARARRRPVPVPGRAAPGRWGASPPCSTGSSGRETSVADPDGFLVRWRDRGPLTPAVEAIRVALSAPLRAASPAVRPLLAAAVEPTELRRGLERAVDRAIGGVGSLEPPTSRWWPVIGFLQMLTTAGIALAVAWIVIGILGGPVAASVQVPIFGSVPDTLRQPGCVPRHRVSAGSTPGQPCRLGRPPLGATRARSGRGIRARRGQPARPGPAGCTRGSEESPVDRGVHARSDLRPPLRLTPGGPRLAATPIHRRQRDLAARPHILRR